MMRVSAGVWSLMNNLFHSLCPDFLFRRFLILACDREWCRIYPTAVGLTAQLTRAIVWEWPEGEVGWICPAGC